MKIKDTSNNRTMNLLYYSYYNSRLKEFFFETLSLEDPSMNDDYDNEVVVINIRFTQFNNKIRIIFILEDEDDESIDYDILTKDVTLSYWEELNSGWENLINEDEYLHNLFLYPSELVL
jgi:hypothetical protein